MTLRFNYPELAAVLALVVLFWCFWRIAKPRVLYVGKEKA